MDVHVEPDGDGGWLVEWSGTRNDGRPLVGYVHLTEQWAEDMRRDQYRPNGRDETPVNRLLWTMRNGGDVADAFAAMYGDVVLNRRARAANGLKAVTRHGDADLDAVLGGAPVRPWNANRADDEQIREFMRGRRANRKR